MCGVAREGLTNNVTLELTLEENEGVVIRIAGESGSQAEKVGMCLACLRKGRETRDSGEKDSGEEW